MSARRTEPLTEFSRLKKYEAWRKTHRVLQTILFLVLYGFPVTAYADTREPRELAEQALQQMDRGAYVEAVTLVRDALGAAPNDTAVREAAGAVLLDIGDTRGALDVFHQVAISAPEDAFAFYGQGLALLARGERSRALSCLDQAERLGGDRACLLIARRYTQWLEGAQISLGEAAVPDFLIGAQEALQGMQDLRAGQPSSAIQALVASQAALPGDCIVQPAGPLMTFDRGAPIATATLSAHAGSGLLDAMNARNGVHGDILLKPEGITSDVAFVSYDSDGETLSLINSRPFEYVWETPKARNGWHTLMVIFYDREVHEIHRSSRRVRILNAPLDQDRERSQSVTGKLWQSLALRPDRSVCAYVLGTTLETLGQRNAARRWLYRSAAIHPDSRDTYRHIGQCGGGEIGGIAVFSGLTSDKTVALTFDDGPKPGVTEKLLSILNAEHVPATFFVIGRHVIEFPELTQQIAAAGMEIANHSYTHPNLTRLSEVEAAREMLATQAAVQTVTGQTPQFVRPPGGNWNGRLTQIARHWGLTPCMWTVDVFDAEMIGAQKVAEAVLTRVRPGAIILMHNGTLSTVMALPTIIHALRDRGYRFATVQALMQRAQEAQSGQGVGVDHFTPRHE